MVRWNPLQEIEVLQREIDQAFERFGSRIGPTARAAFLPGQAARAYPLCNLYEDQDAVYVEALAPGLDLASLSLTVSRHTLLLSGEKQRIPGNVNSEAFHRGERATGKFVRHIELPHAVDENRGKAEYKNGLLVITLPKAEQAKPWQIPIQVV